MINVGTALIHVVLMTKGMNMIEIEAQSQSIRKIVPKTKTKVKTRQKNSEFSLLI